VTAGRPRRFVALVLRHRIVTLVAAVALAAGGIVGGLWAARPPAADPLAGN
jgi:hypothetical protein